MLAIKVKAGTRSIERHQNALDTLRQQTEMAIETLIALLDAIDGDIDYPTLIPETKWPPSLAPFCSRRNDTLDMLRWSIGWQMAG